MKQSFLDYSMSVIVQRALPDVRDGLKPVHRRILFAMSEAGLNPNRPFKKSATVVGDVLGKYHPHGDSAVYDALVRMVQDFSLRYPLVDGQGNFGSLDGDNAAAYRYTEARLAPLATELLSDIDKETVDFAPNFDDQRTEPTVLPAKVPNLLVNGSSGIAVGMSTNIPPHNLREVIRAAIHLLDHPEATVEELMRIIPGPDFPTGGLIVGRKGIRDAYEKGRGRVVMRARVVREQRRGGREQLVVTEIPYATSKTRLIEQIADLVKQGRISDISDMRDESDRDGIRLVIELKRGADPQAVARALFRRTALQSTFGVISLALIGGVPREFTLKQLLEHFRDHRIEVVVRRSRWELERARDEVHVLEGLLIALKNIDETIKLIRGSRTRESAAAKLEKRFKLSERQAGAILDMRLARLTTLETRELRDRLAARQERIRELEAILADPARQIAVIRAELEELSGRYGDARRTRIVAENAPLLAEASAAQEATVVTLSGEGYIKQIPMGLYQRRLSAGRRLAGMERFESDYLERVFTASTTDTLMFFSERGQAYWLPVTELPEGGPSSRGRSLRQLLGLARGEEIVAFLVVPGEHPEGMLVFVTEGGTVKRTAGDQFANPRAGGVNAINIVAGDRLLDVQRTSGGEDLVLVTRRGRAIRFPETDVSEMGRVAQGVRGVKLGRGDAIAGMLVARREAGVCVVTEKGFGAQTSLSELSVQRRGGLGSVIVPGGAKWGKIVAAHELLPGDALMVLTDRERTLRIGASEIPHADTGDGPLVELARGEQVTAVTRAAERRPGSGEGGEGGRELIEESAGEEGVEVGDASGQMDLLPASST